MKTVLFFYLNSFGLILVQTQTRQPYFSPFTTDCKLTKAGRDYAGPLSVTQSGYTCQRWDSNEPHIHRYKDSPLYPDGSASAAGNKCRNPQDNYYEGVWCYTTDPNKRWEQCDVPFCDVGCKQTKAGREYTGPLNVTRSGRICQRWDSDQPHKHSLKGSTLYPEGSASAAGNKCRNPDNYGEGVWCYTTDPNTRWEQCDVELCDITTPTFPAKPKESTTSSPTSPTRTHPPPDSINSTHCKLTKAGREYAGTLSVTKSGRTCQRWDSNQPHHSYFKNSTLFPEGSASAAGNRCRNPQSDYNEGVWCYTTDPNRRWEQCDVPFCGVGCKLTKTGQEYVGPRSVTRSGRTCQRWDSDKPHYSYFKNSTLFPEGSVEAAGNKCRNPDNTEEGVWCYTTDPNKRWELCDVPFCCNP